MPFEKRDPWTRRFAVTHVAVPAAAFVTALVVLVVSGIDVGIVDAFFDRDAGVFPARHSWWASSLLHERGRDAVAVVGVLALATLGLSFVARWARRLRCRAAYVACCIALSTGTVSAWKATSSLACPWSYDTWGGDVPLQHPLRKLPDGIPPGHCFPGGHSSGGWALFALYFVARSGGSRRPLAWLLPGVLAGSSFSLAQWARGAHFPSHDLVSAAVAWGACLVLHLALSRGMAAESAVSAG